MGKFFKVDVQGKHWLQRVASAPAWTADDEARILYDENDDQVKFANSSEWSTAGQYNDVPLGVTILAESDIALIGYSLEVDKDDMISYATKGSGAGGGAGGSDYAGSTWTQPNHTHTQASHQHNVGSHVHSVGSHIHSTTAVALSVAQMAAHTHTPQAGYANFRSTTGNEIGSGGNNYGTFGATGATGSGSAHSHGNTGTGTGNTGSPSGSTNTTSGGGNVTGGGAGANSWRPRGRNFTRQTRI